MSDNWQQSAEKLPGSLELPWGLVEPEGAYRTVFVDPGHLNLREVDSATAAKVNGAIFGALCAVAPERTSGQALIKVHVGEPNCETRMRPEYTLASVGFARGKGASGVVAGDTTTAYSGPRGHRQNPVGDSHKYLVLAWKHGWSEAGAAGVPFVVLDRPSTAVPGIYAFDETEKRIPVEGLERFKDFHVAGGFHAADLVINNAHLTLHGLAGVAGCVKGISMGCASLQGKLRMHQSLLPQFDAEQCEACGRCVESCPEGALQLPSVGPPPTVNPELCIGCGECEAVCATSRGAVTLRGQEITDWHRGKASMPLRMADYTMGLLNGRWERTVHVLHMYSVTERCDCLNERQEPIVKRDLGFLIGKNPFAIDRLAAQMLARALWEEGRYVEKSLFQAAEASAAYVQERYGVVPETPLERMNL